VSEFLADRKMYLVFYLASLCLLIRELRSFIFRVIIKRYALFSPLFVFGVFWFIELIMFDYFLFLVCLSIPLVRFFKIILFTCAYIVWVISPPCPPPPPSPPFLPQFQAGPVLPLSLVLLNKRDKPNKEDKVFLLVDLRITIQKYS
jgi:hypothetical protein